MPSLAKQAGMGDAVRRFVGDAVSPVPATGAAGLAQKLFSNRVKPSDTRLLSGVNILNTIRDTTLGSPIDLARELKRYGHTPEGYSPALALRRLYYRSIVPPGNWKNKSFGGKAFTTGVTAMNLALPAAEVYGASTAPRENRGESIGRAAASIAAAPITMRLGIPGTFLSSGAAEAGGALGRFFDPKPAPQVPQPHPFQTG